MLISKNLKIPTLLVAVSLTGCAQHYDFAINQSFEQVKQVQILDPEASERNEGIVGVLDGQYGQTVMKSYRTSAVKPKEGEAKMSM